MAVSRIVCAFAVIFSLALAPAALAGGNPGSGKPAPAVKTPPPGSPDDMYTVPKPKGHAYGYYCKGASKKHVKGQKGTPFSQCVKAMKALDKGKATSPKKACKGLSKKKLAKVKGSNRRGKTPYAICVSGGKKLLQEKKAGA